MEAEDCRTCEIGQAFLFDTLSDPGIEARVMGVTGEACGSDYTVWVIRNQAVAKVAFLRLS